MSNTQTNDKRLVAPTLPDEHQKWHLADKKSHSLYYIMSQFHWYCILSNSGIMPELDNMH